MTEPSPSGIQAGWAHCLKEAIAVRAAAVTKRFPLVPSGSGWRILLGLGRSGDAFTALDGISLSVPRGKILGVLGRNGAGKSTLLRVLAGVYAPSTGTVSVTGSVASLFELGGLGTRFITGREYAERLLRFQGIRGKRLAELIDEVKEFSELGAFFDRRIYTYSSGMAARLYFAVATAIPKEVFLIDELLSVGDEHFQAKCWRRIRDLLSAGASGVLVTHDWSAVIKLCERSIVLARGKVALLGPSDEVVAGYLGLSTSDAAKFRVDGIPLEIHRASMEDWETSFQIEVKCEGRVDFGFSIELLRLGIGWEILVLSKMQQIADQPGKYQVSVRIPTLPLAPGAYSLNIFLGHHQHDGTYSSAPVRSWTTGNGIPFIVSGDHGAAVATPKLDWRINRGQDASN